MDEIKFSSFGVIDNGFKNISAINIPNKSTSEISKLSEKNNCEKDFNLPKLLKI